MLGWRLAPDDGRGLLQLRWFRGSVRAQSSLALARGLRSAGHGGQKASLLSVHATELNRAYFHAWNRAQLVLGALALALAITWRARPLPIALLALGLCLVIIVHLGLEPRIVDLGRQLDFLPATHRRRHWRLSRTRTAPIPWRIRPASSWYSSPGGSCSSGGRGRRDRYNRAAVHCSWSAARRYKTPYEHIVSARDSDSDERPVYLTSAGSCQPCPTGGNFFDAKAGDGCYNVGQHFPSDKHNQRGTPL